MKLKTLLSALSLSVLMFGVSADAAFKARWSVVIYAGIDEADLAAHAGPILSELAQMPIPEDVEVLIEMDTDSPDGVTRIIRRGTSAPQVTRLPESNSASSRTFRKFLRWAEESVTGDQRVLSVITHSWGWRGIIQDFTVPGYPDADTMMPIRVFGAALRESALRPQVLLLDSCVLGNAEVVEELRGTAPYIVLSQRETPYGGFPFSSLFRFLTDPGMSARELARRLPESYVKAYARRGSMSAAEGEFDVVTVSALDMASWSRFATTFRGFVRALARSGFREKLAAQPQWGHEYLDVDSNMDLLTLIRLATVSAADDQVKTWAQSLLNQIGYPDEVSAQSRQSFKIAPERALAFELRIEADPYLPAETVLEKTIQRWNDVNKDLFLPEGLQFSIDEGSEKNTRYFVVRGEVKQMIRFRPWLPGTRRVALSWLNRSQQWESQMFNRERDYFSVPVFPAESFMLSEAHTQGAPLIHGIGINFRPLMDRNEERATDPLTGLQGPHFYRNIAWSQRTGWGDLILLNQ